MHYFLILIQIARCTPYNKKEKFGNDGINLKKKRWNKMDPYTSFLIRQEIHTFSNGFRRKKSKITKIKSWDKDQDPEKDYFDGVKDYFNGVPCVPSCKDDRGFCHDGLCFCSHPWEGKYCEKVVDKSPRFTHLMVFGCCIIFVFIGFGCAHGLKHLIFYRPMELSKLPLQRREIWLPRNTAPPSEEVSQGTPISQASIPTLPSSRGNNQVNNPLMCVNPFMNTLDRNPNR